MFAFAAPVGTRLDPIVAEVQASLSSFGYENELISLAGLLDGVGNAPWGKLPKRGSPGYYVKRMNAGDQFRRDTDSDAILCGMAVSRVAELRGDKPRPVAFILRSLKHPDEADLLRHIYGDAFWLIAVVSEPDDRAEDFAEELSKAGGTFADSKIEAQQLMRRDEDDQAEPHGQHVQDVFSMADVFLPSRRGHETRLDVERFLDGIYGKPFFTPSPVEEAMRLAYSASLRSAAMGRQVGAVLVPTTGSTYVTGTNEVPKPGGGQFWVGDDPDHRDFQTGSDPNPTFTARMLQELLGNLAKNGWLTAEYAGLSSLELLQRAKQRNQKGVSVLHGTRADSLIEFTRCLHAEQAAIVNAARQGVLTQDALLLTTTFPCHECAKFIVGAGIRRVIYIEPYPKSMVRNLYRDLIDTKPPLPADADLGTLSAAELKKVPFSPFVGFAPHRYDDIFVAGQRREGMSVVAFDRPSAVPRSSGWNETSVHEKEATTAGAVTQLVEGVYGKPGMGTSGRASGRAIRGRRPVPNKSAESPGASEPQMEGQAAVSDTP
ncbi:MAG: hypothetical protein ABIQ09_00160 [Jatrophihabitantaceae bacterium]